MRFRRLRRSPAMLALLLGSILGGAAHADEAVVLGKVKKIRDDAVIEVRSRQTYEVTAGANVVFGTVGRTTLKDAPHGATLVLLGRRQRKTRDPNTQRTIPAQIVQIQAVLIVGAEGLFRAPALATRHGKAKLTWMTGVLIKRPNASSIRIGTEETNLQFGPERAVLWFQEDAAAKDVKKNKVVLVRGEASAGSKKKRVALAATSFLVVHKSAPADQLIIAVGR